MKATYSTLCSGIVLGCGGMKSSMLSLVIVHNYQLHSVAAVLGKESRYGFIPKPVINKSGPRWKTCPCRCKYLVGPTEKSKNPHWPSLNSQQS